MPLLKDALRGLKPGEHLCCLYETRKEMVALAAEFIKAGLERDEKCLLIAEESEQALKALGGEFKDTGGSVSGDKVVVLSPDGSYLKGGRFDPQAMLSLLKEQVIKASKEGAEGLRGVGDMGWFLRGLPGSQRLIEYEAELNTLLRESGATVLCLYDRAKFPAEVLLDVVRTHPTVVVGDAAYRNVYHVPPQEFLEGESPGMKVERYLNNLHERDLAEEALRKSEGEWQRTFDSIEDGLAIIDNQHNIRRANKAMSKLTGIPVEKLVGEKCYKVFHNSDAPVPSCPFEKCKKTRATVVSEMREPGLGDGVYLFSAYPIPDDGEVRAGVLTIKDITEIKKSEMELSTLFDISRAASTTLDLNTLLDRAVKKTIETTGIDRVSVMLLDQEGRGRVSTAYTKKGSKTGVDNVISLNEFPRMKEAIEKRKTIYVPNALSPKTQTPKEIALAKKLNISSGLHIPLTGRGKIIGLLNIAAVGKAREFSENEIKFYEAIADQLSNIIANAELYEKTKRSEEALRESEERYKTIAETSLDGIFLLDASGKIVFLNKAFAEIWGYTREELKGRHFSILVGDDEFQVAEKIFSEILSGKGMRGEFPVVHKDGYNIFVYFSVVPLKKDGKTVGMTGILRDITERKKAEEEIKRRLMRFKLVEGGLYLVKETSPGLSRKAFQDLLKAGFRGLVISRTPEEEFKKSVDGTCKFLWLAESSSEKALNPELKGVYNEIQELPNKSAVLLDSLHYLFFKNRFKEALSFVQRLREHAYLRRHVIILAIDPSTLDNRELSLLEKECMEIEPRHKRRLPEDLLEILKFIYRQNNLGVKPAYSEVGLELGTSKPTVRKRLRQLVSAGYLRDEKKGRKKVVEISEKGRSLFL